MPSLDWIGWHAIEQQPKGAPFRFLRVDPKLSAGDPESGNLAIQGKVAEQ